MFTVYVLIIAIIIINVYSVYNLKVIDVNKYDIIKAICIMSIGAIPFAHQEYLILLIILIELFILLYIKTRKLCLSLIVSVICTIIYLVSDALSVNLCTCMFKLKLEEIKLSNLYYFSYHILIFAVSYFITILIRNVLNKNVDLKNITFKNITFRNQFSLFTFLSLLLTFVIFYLNIVLNNKQKISNRIITINGILFLVYFVLLILIVSAFSHNVKKEIDFKKRKKDLDNLTEYTRSLEIMYNEMRKFRHDYINILTSMVGYIENNDMEGLKNHFNKNIMPISTSFEKKNFRLGLLQNIKIPEIKGIVSSKLIRAQQEEIDIFIDVAEPVEYIDMDIIDSCRVIGIILDNAIEAAEKCENPSVKIAFINKKKSNIIVIINSCPENTPPIYKLFEKGFSTKGDNRGLGLNNLREIIGSYDNVSIDTLIKNGEFIQNIEVFKR